MLEDAIGQGVPQTRSEPLHMNDNAYKDSARNVGCENGQRNGFDSDSQDRQSKVIGKTDDDLYEMHKLQAWN